MLKVLSMCFEPRVLAGLAAVGVLVWITAPALLAPVVPLLLIAACPLSMLAMAWMMRGHLSGQNADPSGRLAELEREQQRIANDIARTRATLAASPPPPARVSAHRDGRGTA